MRAVFLFLLLVLAPVQAWAGDLAVTVRDSAGKPVANAVVTVYPASGIPKGPIRFAWPLTVAQQNIQFDPFVLVAPVGASVSFPNRDKVQHHVYSFSAGNKFELKLFGKDESRSVAFKAVGVAAIGCNIHDQMVGYVKVVDTPFAIKTGADGVASLRGLPAGQVTIRVWHPWLRAPKNESSMAFALPATGVARPAISLEIRRPAGGHMH
ncbi:MAG: methylamine utilization protein [Caulobacteraceae bacterium]|nr:MAG: methylamine utilization protein [Caulobacteraceae bacterium]